jgi:hypothetical protein
VESNLHCVRFFFSFFFSFYLPYFVYFRIYSCWYILSEQSLLDNRGSFHFYSLLRCTHFHGRIYIVYVYTNNNNKDLKNDAVDHIDLPARQCIGSRASIRVFGCRVHLFPFSLRLFFFILFSLFYFIFFYEYKLETMLIVDFSRSYPSL